MKAKILPASEVAYILRHQLGPMRAWDDALADMRANKTNVSGCVLLPTCRVHDGRAWRPGYVAADVVEFIRAVRRAHPDAKRLAPLHYSVVSVDPADTRAWKVRKLPATASCFVFGRPTVWTHRASGGLYRA